MSKEILNSRDLEEIFADCFFRDGEDTANAVIVEGINHKCGFHPGRLAIHKEGIKQMLNELPEQFQAGVGGGWSFLNACIDKEGHQWGEHRNVEQLLLLGLATNQVQYCLPRELWFDLPGGVPYFVVNTSEEKLVS